MAVPLRSVLVSDEVDPQCVALLQQHGIPVTCKFKMPKEELLKEIPVRGALTSLGHSQWSLCRKQRLWHHSSSLLSLPCRIYQELAYFVF